MHHIFELKKLGKAFLYLLGFLFVLTFLMTVLHYFHIIPYQFVTILKLVIPILSLFVSGFVLAKNSKEKGWLEGIKIGLIFLVILVLFDYLGLHKSFQWKDLIYYFILLVGSLFGGMVGINFTSKEK